MCTVLLSQKRCDNATMAALDNSVSTKGVNGECIDHFRKSDPYDESAQAGDNFTIFGQVVSPTPGRRGKCTLSVHRRGGGYVLT